MTLQKIEFEYDIPDGYRFVRLGRYKSGDSYLASSGDVVVAESDGISYWIIVEKIPEQEQTSQNTKRHKHADLIHAWAEGSIIQYLHKYNKCWTDVSENRPSWLEDTEYRIKPKTKTIRFRSYLDRYFGIVKVARSGVPYDLGEWLGDWQNVEIEE